MDSTDTLINQSAEAVEQGAKVGAYAWQCRHYSVQEMAKLWKLSHDSITRIFKYELGVLVITPKKRRGMRTRTTLRIPEHVVERVYRRITRSESVH